MSKQELDGDEFKVRLEAARAQASAPQSIAVLMLGPNEEISIVNGDRPVALPRLCRYLAKAIEKLLASAEAEAHRRAEQQRER